ncbi:MAG TPA: DUF1801 domain-containing protein [bacterium]|nr:DUF1801 domain-containing protein [bacterium]
MRSEATTVEEYLAELPADRREDLSQVREVILRHLPKGYDEVMRWGMITYEVPLKTYPDTYNKQPLMYAALASQKNHMAVYLVAIYVDENDRQKFEQDYKKTGKRLDVGSSCVRFKKIEDLPLALIGAAIARYQPRDFIASFIKETEKRRSDKKKK